ncbi:hypothetical protein [Streptomyces carpaticus]|uniref:Uncharacterized protein n=1 Tax=Streptomyces carpaticus TaxID=285558 RepID=A0ABV4ZJ49_9ACTN
MLEELVLAAGATVVGAMATDGWQAARDGVVRLFRRGGADEEEAAQVGGQLDRGAARVARADDAERARARLVPLWQDEFQDLLRRHPEAAEELRALIDEITASLTAERREGIRSRVQHITAHDNSRVYAAQGGDVHVYESDGER